MDSEAELIDAFDWHNIKYRNKTLCGTEYNCRQIKVRDAPNILFIDDVWFMSTNYLEDVILEIYFYPY